MNWRMYENPAVQKNLDILISRGVMQSGPEEGPLACGEEGRGRMADIADIIEVLKSTLTEKDLENEKIIVTAGPTREYLDPIRFLSNRSSGKMGYALAKAALRRGAEVILISGPSALRPPKGLTFVPVQTADDMLKAVGRHLPSSTVLVMSAAVADYKPAEKAPEKVGKAEELLLPLIRTRDIISEAGEGKHRPFIIGFAAETGEKLKNARKKLMDKRLDMIVFNNVMEPGSGFDVDTNRVVIIDQKKELSLPLMDKDAVADALLDRMIAIKA
jgi:phosphopantothenoylcysteine decarboxylase/phosphopantothenate--cysteine ligase